jgi:AcrR family transcriptional regulator
MVRTKKRPKTQPEINEFRRRALMEATIDILAKKGVAGATVRAISAAADTSHGLIGHYYASKDDLLVAALQHLFDRLARDIGKAIQTAGDDPVARLYAWPDAMFQPAVLTATNRGAFLALWHEMRFNPAVKEANRQLYVGYRERCEQHFRAAAEAKGLEIDTYHAAVGLVALIDGLWLELSIEVGQVTPEGAAALCQEFIDQRLAA